MGGMAPATPQQPTATTGRGRPAPRPVLLISDTDPPTGFHGRSPRIRDRALARWQRSSLDARLAAGCPPDSDRLLAVRALALVRPATRERLARSWDHLLEVAHARPSPPNLRAPVCRGRVVGAEVEIQRMLIGLRACVPIPARGVAIASHLLTDGAGPVYNRQSPVDLRASLEAAARHMDPSSALMAPTATCGV
jgi:hypothetical protein